MNIAELRALGVPFWLAGGYGSAAKLREALEQGAAGVQVGTAFAFSRESGMRPDLKNGSSPRPRPARARSLPIRWPRPPDFPSRWRSSKALRPNPSIYKERKRVCDLGYLREPYAASDGKIALSLLRRAGGKLSGQGRQDRGHGGPQVPVQCAAGQHRPRSGAQATERGTGADHGGRRSEYHRAVPRSWRHSYSAEDVVESLLSGLIAAPVESATPEMARLQPSSRQQGR